MRKEEYIDRPPGPFGGLWSLWYLDPITTIKRELKGFRKIRHKAFAEKIHAGDPAPEVKLKTTDGREVDFAQFRGKRNIVVEFGAITWPPFRRQVPGMEELHRMYKDKGVEFFVVYSREPHPGERKYFRKYSQHTSYAHKLQYAQELVGEFGMKVPVLVDDLEETVAKAFGWMPNMVYVIGLDGRIAYKASWTDRPRVDKVLDELLAEQARQGAAAAKA